MAIRKDLDDMLNNLKAGSPSVRKVQEQKPVNTAPHRKSVYDEMSVDDLLSALTDEKKSNAQKKEVPEKPPVSSDKLTAAAPELEKKLAEVLKPDEIEKKAESALVKPAEDNASPAAEDITAENAVPKKRKKKIVITGELPDYEAIRREEIEKNRIEQEKAEAAAKNAAREANELTPVEAIAAEAIAAAEKQSEAEPAVEITAVCDTEIAQETAVPEEKTGGGLFSGRKNKHRKPVEEAAYEAEKTIFIEETTVIEGTDAEVQTADAQEAPDFSAEAETSIADAFSEALSEAAADEIPEEEPQSEEENQPTVEELLDAAIAGIESAQAAEAALLEASAEEINAAEPDEDIAAEDEEPYAAEAETPVEEEAAAVEDTVAAEEAPVDKAAEEAPKAEEKPKKLVLRRILDENPDAIISERSEKTEDDEESSQDKSKAKLKKRLYMILGAVFSVFAVIGIVTVIVGGVGLIKRFASGEVKKDGFTELVYPAVIMDIEAFDSPDELTSNQMLTASIWSIVMSEERVSKYSVSPGTDTIFIPYMDVEARAVEMFGENHPEFNHCTVGPLESRFVYSDGSYNVKLNPITFTYSPEIRSIVKSGNKYTLTVDYIDELPFWMEKSIAKSVEFSLTEKEDGSYTIDSMGIIYVKSSNV